MWFRALSKVVIGELRSVIFGCAWVAEVALFCHTIPHYAGCKLLKPNKINLQDGRISTPFQKATEFLISAAASLGSG